MLDDHAREYSLLPFSICQEWQLRVGYERSFKVQRGRILANRYLIGVPTETLTLERAREIARRLGMPKLDDETFWRLYPRANLLLIGFEDCQPGCVYKLYLEFDDEPIIWSKGQSSPMQLLHRGIKWKVGDSEKHRVSDYLWQKGLNRNEIQTRIQSIVKGLSIADEICSLVRLATEGIDGKRLRYLEVHENGRRSFDLNLYATGLDVHSVTKQCRAASEALRVPESSIDQMMAIVADRPLGHIAAGGDSGGNEFFTIYYEPKNAS